MNAFVTMPKLAAVARGIVLGIALGACASLASAQDISQAEKILFLSNHFKSTPAPAVLQYDYVQQTAGAQGFKDKVVVEVGKRNADGSAPLNSKFLTETRQVSVPEIQGGEGNPALLGFLERDINEMKRLTGGSTSYFRKRIRMALAESAKVEPTTVTYKGQKLDAQRISIEPYRDDPMQDKMRQYVGKQYTFILSDKVPGNIYQLRTSVPSSGGDAKTDGPGGSIEETMTFAG